MPAEWEPQQAILLSLPDASMDWSYMLHDILECYRNIVKQLLERGCNVCVLARDSTKAQELLGDPKPSRLRIIESELNDTWIRDYGPITIEELSLKSGKRRLTALDFGFNGWGLKFAADKDNLSTLHLHERDNLFFLHYRNCREFVLEGGSIESDGEGTILTTRRCLCSPNRNGGLDKKEVNERLGKYLGVQHILWLDYGALEGDDTDSHIDTLARLCPDNTIIYTGCSDPMDPHYAQLEAMRQQLLNFRTITGERYNLIELPLPDAVYDEEDGHRLPATYCNYLVTDSTVFVPSYNQPAKDELARKVVRIAYPGREVVSIDCLPLIRQHGSLHCATMQIPSELILSR